jgi:glycosyltransferase involved in cell wall biosynthesis
MENQPDRPEVQSVALVGSYVPRRCGIGTFTKDLHDAIAAEVRAIVLAMDDVAEGYDYPPEVRFQIRAGKRADYVNAADLLNINRVDIAIIQHEYGIFGGQDGGYVLDLVKQLRMPVITTLHSVLTEPSPGQAKILLELSKFSDRFVVMSEFAVKVLREVYEVLPKKIAMIPHGIPDVPFVDPAFHKDQFGLEGRTVLLTFGLLSPGKGIEFAIRALPEIRENRPDVVYVVLGATHPHVLKREGDAYRNSLERLAENLGVRDCVAFHNRFVTLEELCGFIGATDIYLTPYLNKAQAVSGTLAYAMGAGKAVVSTPYWYAEELLADGRGRLCPFKDSESLAQNITELLENERGRNAIRKRAYLFCRNMIWKEVGSSYLRLAREILEERSRQPRPVFFVRSKRSDLESLPDVNLAHLRTLSDDTGIIQHAACAVPDRRHGYCTDDNARALIVAMMYMDQYADESVLPLASTYLSFVHHAFDSESRRFRNFMSFDRKWLEQVGSEDVHGRSLWALGVTTALAKHEAYLSLAARLFQEAVETAESFTSPRAWAFAIVGIHAYLKRFQGDSAARRIRTELAGRLYEQFERNSGPDWPWCEDVVTYANARLPHALILSGQWLPDSRMLEQGLRSLEWIVNHQLAGDGVVRLIGNQGWFTRSGHRAGFAQQPVEAMTLVDACAEAFRATQQPIWKERARAFAGWFLGSNATRAVMYDFATGGCRDGLHPDGPSLNQGAESTLAWLLALLTLNELTPGSVLVSSTENTPKPMTQPEGAARKEEHRGQRASTRSVRGRRRS